MSSYRVRRDPFSKQCEIYGDLFMLDVTRAGKWRIYEVSEDYSSTSGGFIVRGKVVRRYDPHADELEGKPAEFESKDQAMEYANRWLPKEQIHAR